MSAVGGGAHLLKSREWVDGWAPGKEWVWKFCARLLGGFLIWKPTHSPIISYTMISWNKRQLPVLAGKKIGQAAKIFLIF